MVDDGVESIGLRLRRLRRDRAMTQEELAEEAGLSVAIIQKLEQGRRSSARTSTLIALAYALDADLSELVGKRPRLDRGDDGVRVLALRDALLTPELLLDLSPEGKPVPLDDLRVGVRAAWAAYWAGSFSRLAAMTPALVAQARQAHRQHGAEAAPLLAQTYQVMACLLVHLGRDDLAVLSAERGVVAAEAGDDEIQWASVHGTFAWALLHQGRTTTAERHAIDIAERIEPSLSRASLPHLSVWGTLLLTAMAAAAAGAREAQAVEHLGLARSAAGRFDTDRLDYNSIFGPSQVAMQGTHTFALLGRPNRALDTAAAVRRDDVPTIAFGRHLVDVAQAQLDRRDHDGAQNVLLEAQALSPEWFRHQGPARTMVTELVNARTRLSPTLRGLARSVGLDR